MDIEQRAFPSFFTLPLRVSLSRALSLSRAPPAPNPHPLPCTRSQLALFNPIPCVSPSSHGHSVFSCPLAARAPSGCLSPRIPSL